MSLSAEILAAITALRKELEDLTQANVRNIYKAQYGEENIVNGNYGVAFQVNADTSFQSGDEYEVVIHEALSEDGMDIRQAVTVTNKTATGFQVSSPIAGTMKWYIFLKVPNFNFWT